MASKFEDSKAIADKVAGLAIDLSNGRSKIECHLLSQVVLNTSKGYHDQNHIFSAISLLKRGVRVVEKNTRVENSRRISQDISRLLIELSNCYLLLSVMANNMRRQSSLRRLSREFFEEAIYLNVVLSDEWSSFIGSLMFRRWVTLPKCELKEEAQQLIALKNYVQSRKFR